MFSVPDSFYAHWRLHSGAVRPLHERSDSPPEKLLQAIWQHQRLLRDELATLDGTPVRVLHPGFLNREGGPDFRGAVLQFGDARPVTGDVEVDIQANGWHGHGHDRNPAFRNVILHVIWDAARSASTGVAPTATGVRTLPMPPAVAIGGKLDAPIGELNLWLNSENADVLPESFRGHCCAPLRDLPADKISTLLVEAGLIRFHSKASQFYARARQVGWEQSLWEGLFRALGYKHNVWPMQCLAEKRQRWLSSSLTPPVLQARLLGIGGLLPPDITRARGSADNYLRRVWDQWWREQEEFGDCILPRSLWRFHGQRPANHPQRRLALAAHWLSSDRLPAKIERWCAADWPDEKLAGSLLQALSVNPDDFWSWHWTIRSARLRKPQPLLGIARVTDLAVNVILPWLWVRAAEGRNPKLQSVVENRFKTWPASEDNAVLRMARQRLLGGASRRALRTAVEQQGLIQIVRDFCDHSNAICDNCHFPQLVQNIPA